MTGAPIPRPVALVYRWKTGCRQYPMYTLAELEKFGSRHPYRNERLMVQPIIDGRIHQAFYAEGPKAAEALGAYLFACGVAV